MKHRTVMTLNLFDGEGAGGAEGTVSEGSATVTEGEAGEGQEEAQGVGEEGNKNQKTPKERQKEFETLIEGEYKDLFDSRIHEAVSLRDAEAVRLNRQLTEYVPLINLLSEHFGVKSGNVEDIIKAIEDDNDFYESAALKEGLSVEQYKNMLKMKAENSQLIEMQRRSEQIRQRDLAWARWDREAGECRKHFPEFNMEKELQNPGFIQLLGAGWDVEGAYKAVHHDEIVSGIMVQTEKSTKKQVADTIRSGYSRPTENQIAGNAASTSKIDVSTMSNEEMLELIKRARSGEIISL